jgi:hypothetical protein
MAFEQVLRHFSKNLLLIFRPAKGGGENKKRYFLNMICLRTESADIFNERCIFFDFSKAKRYLVRIIWKK